MTNTPPSQAEKKKEKVRKGTAVFNPVKVKPIFGELKFTKPLLINLWSRKMSKLSAMIARDETDHKNQEALEDFAVSLKKRGIKQLNGNNFELKIV